MMLCVLDPYINSESCIPDFPLLSQGSKKPETFCREPTSWLHALLHRGPPRCWISARPRSRSERSCACRSQRQGKVAVTFKGTEVNSRVQCR